MSELNYNLEKIFEEMELELIRSMKKSLQSHKDEELKEGFNWEMWQSAKLRELRAYRRRNTGIVGEYMNGIPEEIKKILTEQYNEGADGVDAEVKAAVDNGYITKTTPDFGKVNDKKLNALIDSVNNDFDKVKKAVLRKSTDVYRQTIFNAEMSLAAGAKTLNQAVDMATKLFLSQGLDCITYADGRKVNIASYAKMAVKTAHTRAYLVGEGERRREWKECLVMVSQYMQCSETCLPWQGRVYVDDVYSGASKTDIAHYTAKGYKKLSMAIENGLFHPNCRHSLSTWFEGISTMPTPLNETEVRHNREQTAKENHCRRQIQKYKRLKEGCLDKDNIKKYDKKVKQWLNKLKNNKIAKSDGSGIIKIERLHVEFVKDVQTFTEMQSYMKDNYGIVVDDSVGVLDFQSVREGVQGIEYIIKEFPQAKKSFKTIGTAKEGLMCAGYGGDINFNPGCYKDRETVMAFYPQRMHPKNDNLIGRGYHEAGHILEKALIDKIDGEETSLGHSNWKACTYAKAIVDDACRKAKKMPECKGMTIGTLKNNISRYAGEASGYNASETLAEAVCDYALNKENAAPLSRIIWEMLKKELG